MNVVPRHGLAVLWTALCVVGSLLQSRTATASTAEALEHCHRVELSGPEERDEILAQGVAAAEAAVTADANDARAHFALFCNLGKRLRYTGFSWRTLYDIHRLRRAIDRSLELDPEQADALLGKAALLERLPRLFGGDLDEAEALLGRALSMEPGNVAARLLLAEVLQARGESERAAEQVRLAAALLRTETNEKTRVEAQALLDEWCARNRDPRLPC